MQSTACSATTTSPPRAAPEVLFCDNETNAVELFGAAANPSKYTKDGINSRVVRRRHQGGQPGELRHQGGVLVLARRRRRRARPSRCGSGCRSAAPNIDTFGPGFDGSWATAGSEADEFYATSSTRRCRTRTGTSPAGRTPVCCGPSSCTATTSPSGCTATRPTPGAAEPASGARRRPQHRTGGTCRSPTSSRCPTNGSTPGSPPGTSPSTRSRWRTSTPSSPRNSWC